MFWCANYFLLTTYQYQINLEIPLYKPATLNETKIQAALKMVKILIIVPHIRSSPRSV